MRVSDVISSADDDLKLNADLTYALIVREVNANRDIEVIQFNLGHVLKNHRSTENIKLKERDQIFVFDNGLELDYWYGEQKNQKVEGKEKLTEKHQELVDEETGAVVLNEQVNEIAVQDVDTVAKADNIKQSSREQLLNPIIERLKAQSSFKKPAKLVEVSGAVKFPGTYPLPAGKR